MTAFDAAHAAFLADAPEFFGAYLATYTPQGGASVPNVRVMRTEGVQRQGDFEQTTTPSIEVHISLSDVTQPAPRATLAFDGHTYTLDWMTDRVGGEHTAWLVLP